MKHLLKLLKSILSHSNNKEEHLYYLDGIKRIEANKCIIDECTVTK